MTPEEFGRGVNEVIHATLKVYIEVNNLLREVREQIQEAMPCFPLYSISDGDQALKILRGWRGFLAAPGLYDRKKGKSAGPSAGKEDDSEPEDRGRMLKLAAGGSLMFGKIVLHEYPNSVEPCFIGGVLSRANIGVGQDLVCPATLAFKSDHGRWILDEMTSQWTVGGLPILTDAKVQAAASARKMGKRSPRLQFRLEHKPIHRSLLELDGRDAGRDLAAALMEQWLVSQAATGIQT